jgi:sugar fermentation stimulation protein A
VKYSNIHTGKFISRPNRFIAKVEVGGEIETVHVKNTGRCKELLQPGNTVYLEKSSNPQRKTAYDLIAVEKQVPVGIKLINMDSMAPNLAAKEWLENGGLGNIQNLPDGAYVIQKIVAFLHGFQGKQRLAKFVRTLIMPAVHVHPPLYQFTQLKCYRVEL